ncbi:MAG: hypothetical protein UY78_C0011G0005 [Parcubacteria group bacterium GW2011_GWA1_53_13]|nr:MAG: hypothetical protein UY78_C0011G0005 [Parcubacteria group bacterium GW2011_GWA1_53_13]
MTAVEEALEKAGRALEALIKRNDELSGLLKTANTVLEARVAELEKTASRVAELEKNEGAIAGLRKGNSDARELVGLAMRLYDQRFASEAALKGMREKLAKKDKELEELRGVSPVVDAVKD